MDSIHDDDNLNIHGTESNEFKNQVIAAISRIYWQIYSVDLSENVYTRVAVNPRYGACSPDVSGIASEAFGRALNNYVSEDYRELMRAFVDVKTVAARLKGKETIAEDYLAVDGDWYSGRYIVQDTDPDGNVTHVLFVIQPINEQKNKELAYQKQLEDMVNSAKAANESKTKFLRRISHDIRTPINGILGMIDIADKHRGDKEKLEECKRKTVNAVDYLLSLVNNILDMGKVESEGFMLENQPFDLENILMTEFPVMEMQAAERGIKYYGGRDTINIEHRYLVGSSVHLSRILMNIANNAIKYNRKGGTVRMSCTEIDNSETTEKAIYRFTCEDNGIGMSEEFVKHAFEPFAQEMKSSDNTYAGTGLGLAIVKEIVDKMGGTINLESRENEGTSITLTIPFAIDIDHKQTEKTETPNTDINVDMSGRRILLVDDDELNREIAQVMLEDMGFVITQANNGSEAYKLWLSSPVNTYDYIFMDIILPVMNGLEATKAIRQTDREDAGRVKIIAMTANAFQDDVQDSVDAGMNAYLMKPLSRDKIKNIFANNMTDVLQ